MKLVHRSFTRNFPQFSFQTCGHLLLACLAATRSASSLPFHLIRNMRSPEVSVAPIMRSG